uniref:6-cysteine protein n=1 Tax=Parastrongyloides trichosuri TaxID=131310 RepID=A0A0N4ZIB3_PARTI
MKLLLFIIILVVGTVFSKKATWDGKNIHISKYKISISKLTEPEESKSVELKNDIHFLKNEINMLDHVTFINVPIYPINIDEYGIGTDGVIVRSESSDLYQTFPYLFTSVNYLSYGDAECFLRHCYLGLYLYHKNYKGGEIISHEVTDFNYVIYVKLTSETGEYLIGEVNFYGPDFSLLICPYDNWVSPNSMVKYIPYDRNGIELKNLMKIHILLPILKEHREKKKFLCGYLKYLDGDELKIGFRLYISRDSSNFEIKKVNVKNDYFVCKDGEKEREYYHIAYNIIGGSTYNRYINMESSDKKPLFYGETIYLYEKSEYNMKRILRDGFKYYEEYHSNNYSYTYIEPSCGLEINPISGKLILRRSDNKSITLNDNKLSDVKILYITNDLLEETVRLECAIEGEGERNKYDLKNFYNYTFGTELVSIDEKNNVKTINQINFGNVFKKFGCILKPLFGYELPKYSELIKPLYFETRYDKDLVITQKWKNNNKVSIECKKELWAKLTDMEVIINSKYIYKMSEKENNHFFLDTNNYVKFKHYEIKEIKNGIRKVKYECFYKTKNDVEFSIKYDGIVLEKTVVENDKKENSSEYEDNKKNPFQHGDNKKNSFQYGILLISIITTIAISTIVIVVVLIFVLGKKRNSRNHEIISHKNRKYKYSKGRSTSDKSDKLYRSSGDSEYISELKKKQKN